MPRIENDRKKAPCSSVNGRPLRRTGTFLPTATLSGWLLAGSGLVLSEAGQTTVRSGTDLSLLGEP